MTASCNPIDAARGRPRTNPAALVIDWSRRRRFQIGVALARRFAGGRVLDYGCGDGTFLGLLQTEGVAHALAVGVDIDARLVADCQRRFAAYPTLRFADVSTLERACERASYDAIFCMEVLEHVIDPAPVLADFERLLRPDGTLLVSVPVETGLPVLVKQIVRTAAGWTHVGDYPGTSGYGPLELVKTMVAGSRQHVARPSFERGDGSRFHDHKGFNWRVLRGAIADRFDLVSTVTSPFARLGPHLATQIWFVARRRRASAIARPALSTRQTW